MKNIEGVDILTIKLLILYVVNIVFFFVSIYESFFPTKLKYFFDNYLYTTLKQQDKTI